ncbi:MAG TPA: CAP domain-containing protein [Thermoanaerobaculia bacterium]|nr:CAP domain-containing protein [Thermoanaerobaculia bacterium]
MKRFLVAVALLLAGSALASDSNEITVENVLRLLNERRAQSSLRPLAADDRLMRAANDRMRHMEEESYWGHHSPDGLSPFSWVTLRSYEFRSVGENLACGFDTARMLVEAWMESPGHRANILSNDYEDCGIAIIDGSTKGPANGKSIVMMFAKKKQPVQRAHVN